MSKSTWLLALAFFLAGPLSCNVGCSLPANPNTKLSAGPFGSYFSFSDSKDNDIEIEDAQFDPLTKSFSVKRITIRNNSSDPRRANVEQIQAYTEQVKAVGQATVGVANALGAFAPLFMPRPPSTVTLDVPGFGTIRRETPEMPAVITMPTTQPVSP